MKEFTIFCITVALCAGHALAAENEKVDDKKVPPGLQKKGGVPPGQAKKKGETEATKSTTPSPSPTAPATVNTPAPAPAPALATTPTKTATPTAKPAAPVDPKAALEANTRAINHATVSNPANHKAALQHISKQTGVTLEHLKEQDKNFPNASDTGLLLGNLIAKHSGVKFADVMNARQKGKDWETIAKGHNVDFGLLVQKSAQLAKAIGADAR